jgi:hypothetical protein
MFASSTARVAFNLAIGGLAVGVHSAATADSISGFAGTEYRYFLEAPLDSDWSDGAHRIVFAPFVRLDSQDDERTHGDIRELYWRYRSEQFEWRVGVRQVFWGVTESRHLVDVINQTDLVEDIDGERKLGQPMLNVAWIRAFGTVELFVLPYFRERTFPGVQGRPRAPLPIDTDATRYTSSAEENHIDVAIRYSHTLDNWDIGVAYFHGTARDPLLMPEMRSEGWVLVPVYDVMDQTGIDVQHTHGGWLWKLEALHRTQADWVITSSVGGFEYTFSNLFTAADNSVDVGVLAEYSHDLGSQALNSPFDRTLFTGVRVAFNDAASSSLLAGVNYGLDDDALVLRIEAERRFGQNWSANFTANGFSNIPADSLLYGQRRDSYLQIEARYHF